MDQSREVEILAVTTTVGSVQAAQRLARELLAARLAACVQIEPGLVSHYRWKGELCEEPEVRLVIKTVPGRESALQALFAQHHPYELPQFTAVTMQASDTYSQWVRAEVA
ncbi:MAG TPA: divalent-cation tolerance protein CutA [Ramlibacter sp.]|jgi:periplasmic divalent cation tolerance protein|nr:divalent-cation tolerance protein CutA [Ramlibacter sp.]